MKKLLIALCFAIALFFSPTMADVQSEPTSGQPSLDDMLLQTLENAETDENGYAILVLRPGVTCEADEDDELIKCSSEESKQRVLYSQ